MPRLQSVANATSEQCVAALLDSAGQPGDVRNANMEALPNNQKIALELRTALRQVLIATKDVPLTDGYKKNLLCDCSALAKLSQPIWDVETTNRRKDPNR